MSSTANKPMVLNAVASSTRNLLQILRCITVSPKAHIQISAVGIRFSVQEARAMQGFALLQKELFSSYTFHGEQVEEDDEEDDGPPVLQISLESLLETLQIFGVNETRDRWSAADAAYGGVTNSLARGGPGVAFDNRVLGTTGICKWKYEEPGAPLCIVLEEASITTTCELTIYEPDPVADIPFDKSRLVQKIIMRSSWLHDAITELSATSPSKVTMIASSSSHYFALSSDGPHGSATVEFSTDPQLLETFEVSQRVVNTYKYSLVKTTSRAMALASKVSIRVDEQGVLSLQFLIELETGIKSFVDFRFVPYISEEGEDGEGDMDEEVEADQAATFDD